MPPKDVKKSRSKGMDTTIVVALIALIGTFVTALSNSPVILEWIRNKPTSTAVPTQAEISSNNPPNTTLTSAISSLSGGEADCLEQYFTDIDPARQISIEVGDRAHDYVLLSQDSLDQNFIGPFGISLTQNGRMIGALSFRFFTDSYLFKIISVVDSNCQEITEYSNAIRGGDKNAIQNSETLKIQLAEGIFFLNFQFSYTNFFRFNFQQLQ
jgi:hypothetical protein